MKNKESRTKSSVSSQRLEAKTETFAGFVEEVDVAQKHKFLKSEYLISKLETISKFEFLNALKFLKLGFVSDFVLRISNLIPPKFRINTPRRRFAGIIGLIIIISSIFLQTLTQVTPPKPSIADITLPYQEKVAEGVYELKKREPIHQVLAEGPKVDLNLKEVKIQKSKFKSESENSKVLDEQFKYGVTNANGTRFEFGAVNSNTPEGKVIPKVRIQNKEKQYVSYSSKYQFVTPKVQGNIIEWEISPGIKARYTMMSDRVKADYIVNSKSSIVNGKLDFDLSYSEDLKAELMPEGSISFLNKENLAEAFNIPSPVVTDSKVKSKNSKVNDKSSMVNDISTIDSSYEFEKIKDGEYSLAIILDSEDLESATFPLTIDPVVIDAAATTTGTAYANGRKILRDAWGNLIAFMDGGTGNDNVYYKNYDSTIWTDANIDLDSGAGSAAEIASDLDSSGSAHLVWRNTTSKNIEYMPVKITRNGNNAISTLGTQARFTLDSSTAASGASVLIANKGGGAGVEKIAVAYSMNGLNRGEVRFMQCDVADACNVAANWKNASEEINGGGSCSDTAVSGAAGLPNSPGTCKGTADKLFNVATTTKHHAVLAQMPGKPKRSPASVKKDINGSFTTLSNTIDNNTGTTEDVSNFGISAENYMYVGDDKPFSKITVDLTNINSNSGSPVLLEYCSAKSAEACTTWTAVSNLISNEGTALIGFSEDGSLLFDEPSNWITHTVDGVTSKYWIRIVPQNSFDATVSIAEVYITDRNSKALIVVGGVDSTDDLRAAYIPWDEVGNAGWENRSTTVGVPWIQDGGGASSALADYGGDWTTWTKFPLSATVDYKNNLVYVAYADSYYIKYASSVKDLTVNSNWTDTGFTSGVCCFGSISLASDGADIYLFTNNQNKTGLVFIKCIPNLGGNGNICDVAADWNEQPDPYPHEHVLDNGTDIDHPQAVVTKVTGDTLAIDTIYTTTTGPAVEYERHYVDNADKTVVVAASGDDAYEVNCVSGTDDQFVNSEGVKLGREDADANCAASADSLNHVGLRFPNITVAQGSLISSAYIDIRVATRSGSTVLPYTVYGEDTDNSSSFTGFFDCADPCSNGVNTRTKTTSSTSQSVNFTTNTYRIDVTKQVQEIICRGASQTQPCVGDYYGSGTWASGNALTLLLISSEADIGADNNMWANAFDLTGTTMLDPTLQINVAPSGTTGKSYSMGSATQLATGSGTLAVANLDHPLSSVEYGAVASDDTHYASVSATTNYASQSAVPAFMFKVNNSNNNNTYKIDASAIIKTSVNKPIYLQAYRDKQIAENTLDTSTSSTSTTYSPQRKLFYDTSRGLWWSFYNNGSAIEYSNSSDGASWTSRGTTAVATSDFSVWYVTGTNNLYLVYIDSGVKVQTGTLSSTSISWGSTTTVDSDTDNTNPNISRDTAGKLWVVYRDTDGADNSVIYANRSTNTDDTLAWDAQKTVGTKTDTDNSYYYPSVLPLTTAGDMLFIWRQVGTAPILISRLWDESSNDFGSVDSSMTDNPAQGYSAVSSSSDTVHLVCKQGNSIYYRKYSSGSWSSRTSLISSGGSSGGIGLAIDSTSEDLFLFDLTSENYIYYSKAVAPYATSNWTDRRLLYSSGTNISLTLTAAYNTGNSYAGFIWTNGTGSPYNVKFMGQHKDAGWVTKASNMNPSIDTDITLTSSSIKTDLSHYYFNETPGIGTQYAECTDSTANCWSYWRIYQDTPSTLFNSVLAVDYVNVAYSQVGPDKVAFSNSARTFTTYACNGAAKVFTMELQNGTTPTNPETTTVVRVTSDSGDYTIYSDDTCSTSVTNGDFTYTTAQNTKSVYIIDRSSAGTKTLTGTRQSGDTLTTGQQNYTLDDAASSSVRGGMTIRGGTTIR